jgi:hypothetical protein
MKNIAWFWLMSVLGIVIDLIAALIFFMIFIMLAQTFFLTEFIVICVFLVTLFIVSIFGLFNFKKWGRNIFLILTLLSNIFLLWLFYSRSYLLNIILLAILFLFIYYFMLPSTRLLFDKSKILKEDSIGNSGI